jgi:acyl-CoA synthetase (AMP-forming)/AMP-acid ligase II
METIAAILAELVEEHPDKTGFKFIADDGSETCLTYSELWKRARSLAHQWSTANPEARRVAICMPSGLDFVTAIYASLLGGFTAIPLTPPIRKDFAQRCVLTIADSQPDFIVTIPPLWDVLKQITPASNIFLVGASETSKLPPTEADAPLPKEADIAVVQYTSATGAGTAKGVMLSQTNILHNLAAIQTCMNLSAESKMASWLPPYHVMQFIGSVLLPVYAGFPSVLMSPQRFRTKPVEWLRMIVREAATVSGGPCQAFDLCVQTITDDQLRGVDLTNWAICYCGSEPINSATLDRFATRFAPYGFRKNSFFPCYGLAESTLIVAGRDHRDSYKVIQADRATLEQGNLQPVSEGTKLAKVVVSCGKPCAGVDVKIVDPRSGATLNDGSIGEICVRSSSVGLGYWNRRELTREVFGTTGQEKPGVTFLKTGDLGCIRDQELYVTGRLNDLIIIWARKLHPEDLEACAASSDPGGGQSRTLVAADGEDSNPGVIVLQEIDPERLDNLVMKANEIRRRLRTEFDITASRVAFISTDSLPLTVTGKIRRKEAIAKFLSGEIPAIQAY